MDPEGAFGRNYTIVWVAYCTGDLHVGSATQTYYMTSMFRRRETPAIEHTRARASPHALG